MWSVTKGKHVLLKNNRAETEKTATMFLTIWNPTSDIILNPVDVKVSFSVFKQSMWSVTKGKHVLLKISELKFKKTATIFLTIWNLHRTLLKIQPM